MSECKSYKTRAVFCKKFPQLANVEMANFAENQNKVFLFHHVLWLPWCFFFKEA